MTSLRNCVVKFEFEITGESLFRVGPVKYLRFSPKI